MKRRDFIKQGLIISSLPLLPNIAMGQVRTTVELESYFSKAFMRGAMAGRNLVAFLEKVNVSTEKDKQEIKRVSMVAG